MFINKRTIKSGIKSILKSLAGIPYQRHIYKSWSMTSEEFWEFQNKSFKQIYNFALQNIPYYKQNQNIYMCKSDKNNSVLEILQNLPILKKQTVKEYNSDFWPARLPMLTSFHTTSGTSGTPLRIPATLSERGFFEAISEEWMLRCCGSRRPRSLFLSGFMTPLVDGDLYWRDPTSGDIYLSIYSLNPSNKTKIISLYHNFMPKRIYGYASAIHQLALLAGDSLTHFRENCIAISTSEVLQDQWRTIIEASLCRKVYNLYGSQEGCHQAVECVFGKMHINPLVGIIEIVDEEGHPVHRGELGRVLVTGLARKSMPLIRYELGDMVESTGYATVCDCGLHWPTIGKIEGRSEDLVRTKDGRQIGYLCFHATKNLKGIKESQLIQVGYDRFIFNIVKSETEVIANDVIENAIQNEITNRLRLDVNIEFKYLNTIPRSKRGKFKSVVVDFEG